MAGATGDSVRSVYGASKAGGSVFDPVYHCTACKDRIRCNGVAPGLIVTPAKKYASGRTRYFVQI
ncbi:SDR family NAD(P)-dependent oxidoreductase [Bacillus sp. SD075]|uniref:SDR family NAD(P)-dependent oxidoreductase n=1 Tax=Bacillus sp. SD075 TaxID=2781732 RepID=UPI0025710991|nr:SDR family NAD(P)-dependent oxidoreductase [Bacillus sp. SD075]